ncbi:dual-domain HisK/Mak2 protein kinase [Phellopilus nigrolimitatus]|nr:dual-domain HisK/Mak2 protein kinase [Phellopilus nigrolimitatus]
MAEKLTSGCQVRDYVLGRETSSYVRSSMIGHRAHLIFNVVISLFDTHESCLHLVTKAHMRRKLVQPVLPNLFFVDGQLSIPGFIFETSTAWDDTGSQTILSVGTDLKDGSDVLAKIAPATGSGSICLEREAHILDQLSGTSEATTIAFRVVEYMTLPKESGDCVILLLSHPGPNLLGNYFPSAKVNELLLAGVSETQARLSPDRDTYVANIEESDMREEHNTFRIMDLASFLEFAIQATHCLELIHKLGIIHREVRANAFHLNDHSGLVRFAHFGNRSVSLEQLGGPSALVIAADTLEELSKRKVKEALCYLAPEQTGSVETSHEDQRTDLYSLGILFWTLLVGQGQMPFEGSPTEILYAIPQRRPMPVHEFRRDVPHVVALIIEKLLAKSPDARYNSAYGLKADLLECQRRLLAVVSSSLSEQLVELIPSFEIGLEDKYLEFTIPNTLFGREKELEIIRNAIRQTATSHARQYGSYKSPFVVPTLAGNLYSGTSQSEVLGDDRSESMSSISDSPSSAVASLAVGAIIGMETVSRTTARVPSNREVSPTPISSGGNIEGPRSRTSRHTSRSRVSRTRSVVVAGPAGMGKSSLILANQAKWRSHGLWGHAKFQKSTSAPFTALLSCLSSVLRQLMIFQTDLHRFVMTLRNRLGPLLLNAPLLYQGAPELKDILLLFDVEISTPEELLSTAELRLRFQTLVEQIFAVLAEVRLLALFLDDLHEADESSLDLIQTLANSKSRMLIIASVRSEDSAKVERLRQVFGSKSRVTWIVLEPLSSSAVLSLVSRTLHRSKEDCLALSRIVYRTSQGNAFSVRNFLNSLHRHHQLVFDWQQNCWTFDLKHIEASLVEDGSSAASNYQEYLASHWQELPSEARRYLIWASFFGTVFRADEVASVIDWEDSSGSSGSEEEDDTLLSMKVPNMKDFSSSSSTRASMKGLQAAIAEGWLMQRAREMCSFSHDRYRQAAMAEAEKLSEETIANMSLRIILMLRHDDRPADPHRVAEHAKRCINIFKEHPIRDEILEHLFEAGLAAWTRGAHELALESLKNAQILVVEDHWQKDFQKASNLYLKLAELYIWKGEAENSNIILSELLRRAVFPEDKARCLKLSSENKFFLNDFSGALRDTMTALEMLGISVNLSLTKDEMDKLFEQVKDAILAIGFDRILESPRTEDPRIELAVQLLSDAGMNAYWIHGDGFSDVISISLTTVQVALRSGTLGSGAVTSLFWMLGYAAERRDMYNLSKDLGRLALRLADSGSSSEKCRALVLYTSMVSGYDGPHIRVNVRQSELAQKFGLSAGDRLFVEFSMIHLVLNRFYTCENLSELIFDVEDVVRFISRTPQSERIVLATGLLILVRSLGGQTLSSSAATVFDTESFKENAYLNHVIRTSGNVPLVLGWYNAFKVVGLYCMGYFEESAELGFSVYESRHYHPNHRHVRFALCYHSLAMISCIRGEVLSDDQKSRFMTQINLNQALLRKWSALSPVNNGMWVALVDAELASLQNTPDVLKLYDTAVTLASNDDWLLEEGWALYLQGSHLVRCGVEGLGCELQQRGISKQSQWGAKGIVNHLTSIVGISAQKPHKKNIFSSDVAVQTENIIRGITSQPALVDYSIDLDGNGLGEDGAQLTSSDLSAILRWSNEISSDINLSSALRRLTEIGAESSGAQCACVVMARETGDYTVATSIIPPAPCLVHEHPKSVRTIKDPLQRAVIEYCLNAKTRVIFDDTTLDSRFASEAQCSPYSAVICLPIFSNRGQTFGAIYLGSRFSFLQSTVAILTLLLQQASISISNALLFRSVQVSTRENIKMISSQRAALEEARRSREDALGAAKAKSNFLASMSHELRTPFSSFYGLLDILSSTELDPAQIEIVATAKVSCDLLLKVIDSILSFSSLEAAALKLELSGFPVEDVLADCMELLLPTAAKKLDMSFDIEPDVPPWVEADYARIRQILMNLLGNAVKFTSNGSVRAICSIDKAREAEQGSVFLKFMIQDTGIGLSEADKELLFTPFHQADGGTTRRFGGTGLGLSISRQLVQLMGGTIGVEANLGRGSLFWFTIPVKNFKSDVSQKALADIEHLKSILLEPRPPFITICSPSDATLSLLGTMLDGFFITSVKSIEEIEESLRHTEPKRPVIDFILVDHQSELRVDALAKAIQMAKSPTDTKIIHLFTPTSESLSRQQAVGLAQAGVVRSMKPPRRLRLLQTLATLKGLPTGNDLSIGPQTDVSRALEDITTARRTLFGNVLIAEDNELSRRLLKQQLERHKLKVTATTNGSEAVQEWEAHKPGYFSLALFDHHMPICDGIEACKQIRLLESKHKVSTSLPIVGLSADAQDSTKQLCLSAGMNAFFSKPLKQEYLKSLLSMFETFPLETDE